MTKIFLTCIAFFSLSTLIAQVDGTSPVTEAPIELKDAVKPNQDRVVLDLTFDNWNHQLKDAAGEEISTKWWSRGFGIYFMYDIVIQNSNFSIAPGIGIHSYNVYHDALVNDDSLDMVTLTKIPDNDLEDFYKTNKFSTTYAEVPLEIRYRSKRDNNGNSFKVALGAKIGLKLDAHTKVRRVMLNSDTKVFKNKRFDEVSTVNFGPTFRIGYGSLNLLVHYQFTELFNTGEGPGNVHPFSIGISFNGL